MSDAALKRIRWDVFIGLVLVFAICTAYNLLTQSQDAQQQRKACERGNARSVSELRQRQNLIVNAKERASNPRTATEGEAALVRAKRRKQELINSVADVASEPGSVITDCKEAWPLPAPLNWIEGTFDLY